MRQVLVVEADEVLTDVMVEVLTRDGCEVTAVRSIGEAVCCLSGKDADVDMVMFDADTVSLGTPGEPLTKWQAWIDRCPRPPACMIVRVQAASARLLRFLRPAPGRYRHADGPAVWLRKPFRNEELLAAVRQVAGGRRAASDA